MKNNIIIEKSFKYAEKIGGNKAPENCIYSERDGFWINLLSQTPMMAGTKPPRPRTKKEDVETGEDQKGA